MKTVIDHLQHRIGNMIEGRRWKYNELRKEFPYKCWPRTKKAAIAYKKMWVADIKRLNTEIALYRKAIKILKQGN